MEMCGLQIRLCFMQDPCLKRYLKKESQLFQSHSYITVAVTTAKSLQSCPTLCDPIDGSHQSPLSLGFSRQEYWSGLPFP